MISNGTKLIKGKYERPAVAVAGEQKKCQRNFCQNPGFLSSHF